MAVHSRRLCGGFRVPGFGLTPKLFTCAMQKLHSPIAYKNPSGLPNPAPKNISQSAKPEHTERSLRVIIEWSEQLG